MICQLIGLPAQAVTFKAAPQKTEYIDKLVKALNNQAKYRDALDFIAAWRSEHPNAENATSTSKSKSPPNAPASQTAAPTIPPEI